MTAQLLPPGQITFFDDDGNPLSNGLVYFYIPSTTTFKNTWQDRGQLSLNTNPVQLDAAGRATIWGDGVYRQRVFDELGNEIWDKIVSTVDTSNNTGASGYYGGFTAVGGETSFPLLNQDGDSFTVAAGAEVTLGIYINGVKLELENYSTDGSDIVTLINSTTLVSGDLVYYEQTGGINLNVPGPGSITSAEQFGAIVTFTGRTLSGGTLTGQTITNASLSGTTTLPGSGQITSGGSLIIGAGQSITVPTITTASGALVLNSASNQLALLTGSGSVYLYTSGGNTVFQNQSASSILFNTNAGTTQFAITNTTSSVNFWSFTGNTAGNNPYMQASGSDYSIGMHWFTKGDGSHRFYSRGTGGSGYKQFAINSSATNAVNNFAVQGGATGVGVYLYAEGSDPNIEAYYSTKGSATHRFFTGGINTAEQFRIAHTASTTNFISVTGSNGSNPIISTNGGALALRPANGQVSIGTGTGSSYIYASGGNTVFQNQSATSILFNTNAGTTQFAVAHTANAVNYFNASGSATGNPLYITATGSDANISAYLRAKGTGYACLVDGSGNRGVLVGTSTLGFFENTGTTKQTVTGSRGGNAALASLLTALAGYGILTDSTTA